MAADLGDAPSLASAELEIALERNAKRTRTGTSCTVIDEALRGGVDSGIVTCISGDRGLGKSTVSCRLPIE